ncbi:hypothetical protein, partial [Alicyclobacillus herbarius]|uniref:hypothetical protein n=1 Tax=Alicyclobacillus herbarius TaxID=122960 RepID=UPI002356DFB1
MSPRWPSLGCWRTLPLQHPLEAEYPSKGWPLGLIDTCGFREPISYLTESLWSEKPMVHMAVFDDTLKQGHIPRWTMHWKSPKLASHWT